ncbi:hypothetical protein B0H13DRAFT_2682288 [Mycena leptocephala]|nr:hypothetical protein B0H13DRAFT_2682288 [Mycena leptocephala]
MASDPAFWTPIHHRPSVATYHGEFDTTLGALCVAYVLAWGLFGVMSMQSFDYFQKFVKDSVWLKSLVGFLWYAYRKPLSTYLYFRQGPGYPPARADRTCIVLLGYTNYDNPKVLAVSVWSFNIGILNLTVLIVEVFLARLSNKNSILTGIIVLLSFSYFGFEMAVQVRTFQLKKISLFFEFQWIASVGLACAAAADLIIAFSLCFYLMRSRTGIKTTDTIVNRLVLYAMNTGLLTAICVLIDMICFLTMPKNLIHIAFNLVVGKLYTNSLLATLNFRDTIRSNTKDINTFSLGAMNATGTDPAFSKLRTATNPDLESAQSPERTLNITSEASAYGSTRSIEEMKFSHAV